MSVSGLRGALIAVFVVFAADPMPAAADLRAKAGVSNIRDDINPALREKLQKEIERQEKERKARLEKENIRVFEKDGVPTFTNRPAKYRAKPGYVELNIQFEPIMIDPALRKLKLTNNYSRADIDHIVEKYARRWGLEKNLIYAVIKAESNFRQDAVSPAGARGLMQLMPGTAAEMGVTDPFDPAENIAGGTQYLAKMLQLFDGNLELALAGYNAGPQTVINCGRKVPNIRETQNYVKIVQRYKRLFDGNVETVTFTPAKKKPRLAELPKTASDGKVKTVCYLSGSTQPADRVEEHGELYVIQFKGRIWSVPKKLVKEIV
jgi:soluble lytic murein transglycosylase-like protein